MASSTDTRTVPPLIPAPAELAFGEGAFTLYARSPISFAGKVTLATARELQSAIQGATGLKLPLGRSTDAGVITVTAEPDDLGPEEYVLAVTPEQVSLRASTDAGAFYGVQTFRQLLRVYGGRLPAMTIRDRPVLAHRGVMLDVSRGKVPTREALFHLVEQLSRFKYNQLQLYVEHTFAFASHPDIGAGVDPLTPEDILALDELCRERHVELVPNLQSFGHQRHLLSLPAYQHLDEVGWRWSLSPAREETYTLLEALYADFLSQFTSGWLNIDCDETWDLGTGQSKRLADELGKGRLYLRHILRLRELAAEHGRRIMLWADVLHHYPELVPELPEDVLLLDWEYEAAAHYATTDALAQSGRAFWVCPGSSSWNSLFPRLDNCIGNIRQFVQDGLGAGASGMLLTDWGDYGHYAPLSLSWYPYLYGAATAWTGAGTDAEDFDTAFAVHFVGDRSAVAAMRRLGRAVTLPGLGLPNRSNLALGLFQDPVSGTVASQAPRESLLEVKAAAEDAISAWSALPDASLRHDYSFSARLIAFTVDKLLGSTNLARDRQRALALREEFESVWLRQARRSEIDFILGHFDALLGSYDNAIAGRPSQPRAFLWEQGRVELRKLADLAGVEALPEGIREWIGQT